MSGHKNEEQNTDTYDLSQKIATTEIFDGFENALDQEFCNENYADLPDEFDEVAWEIDAIEHEMEQMMALQQEIVDLSDLTFQHDGTVYTVAIHPINQRIIASGGGANCGIVFILPENCLEKFQTEKKQDDISEKKQDDISEKKQGDISEKNQTIPFEELKNDLEAKLNYSNLSKINVIFRFQHSDPICCVIFSPDGTSLVSSGYDGHVKIWETQTGVLKYDFSVSADVDWVRWHPESDIISAGSKDGNIWVWSAMTGQSIHVFDGHVGPVTCGAALSKNILVTGSEDGTVRVWDIEEKKCMHVFSGSTLQNPITCISSHRDAKLILTGSEDGIANILDISNFRIATTLFHCGAGNSQSQTDELLNQKTNDDSEPYSIETIGFSACDDLCATGGMDGILKIWNFVAETLLFSCVHHGGITKLEWHTTLPIIFTGCTDGNIRVWDASSGELKTVFTGHQDLILDMKVVPINLEMKRLQENEEEKDEIIKNMIVSGSDDQTIKFFFY